MDEVISLRGARRLKSQRTICDLYWLAIAQEPRMFAEHPDVAISVVCRLKDKEFPIGSPVSAAFRRRLAPGCQEWMKVGPIGSNLPQFGRLALGFTERKPQVSTVRRPAQPKCKPRSGDELMRVAAVDADNHRAQEHSARGGRFRREWEQSTMVVPVQPVDARGQSGWSRPAQANR